MDLERRTTLRYAAACLEHAAPAVSEDFGRHLSFLDRFARGEATVEELEGEALQVRATATTCQMTAWEWNLLDNLFDAAIAGLPDHIVPGLLDDAVQLAVETQGVSASQETLWQEAQWAELGLGGVRPRSRDDMFPENAAVDRTLERIEPAIRAFIAGTWNESDSTNEQQTVLRQGAVQALTEALDAGAGRWWRPD